MAKYDIYTDGACSGNPGKGGSAFVVVRNGVVEHFKQTPIFGQTTNNFAELAAMRSALMWCWNNITYADHEVTFLSDSKYVVNILNGIWQPKNNLEAWSIAKHEWKKVMDIYDHTHGTTRAQAIWVKGHDGNIFNELCDQLAKKAIKKD